MNLRSIDLNLLVVLDALLEERHVSRAAARLGLSQPATSAALQRCRFLFGDPLLERGGSAMRPTPRAEALRAPLKSLLAATEHLVARTDLPLHQLRQTLRLTMADHPALVVTARLLRALRDTAPGLDLVIQPWLGADAARQALIDGSTDIAVSVFPAPDDDLHREALLRERYMVVMRRRHPAARNFTLRSWLRHPHILVSGRGDQRTPLDAALAERGLSRRIGLVVPSFQLVPALLAECDMIAMLPSRCVPDDRALAVFPPPIPVEGFTLHLAWHKRRRGDRAVRHLAGVLADLLA